MISPVSGTELAGRRKEETENRTKHVNREGSLKMRLLGNQITFNYLLRTESMITVGRHITTACYFIKLQYGCSHMIQSISLKSMIHVFIHSFSCVANLAMAHGLNTTNLFKTYKLSSAVSFFFLTHTQWDLGNKKKKQLKKYHWRSGSTVRSTLCADMAVKNERVSESLD